MSKVEIDKKSCVHCGACTAVCNENALQMKQEDWTLVYKKTHCNGCGSCVIACPLRAVSKTN